MATNATEAFNDVAEKVVSLKELRQKTNEIYKAELSFGEKAYLNLVDKPGSLVTGAIIATKDLFTRNKRPGGYVDAENFPPRMYVSGSFMTAMLKDNARLSFTPDWDAKLIGMTRRAFDACEDVSKTPKMQALKPL